MDDAEYIEKMIQDERENGLFAGRCMNAAFQVSAKLAEIQNKRKMETKMNAIASDGVEALLEYVTAKRLEAIQKEKTYVFGGMIEAGAFQRGYWQALDMVITLIEAAGEIADAEIEEGGQQADGYKE